MITVHLRRPGGLENLKVTETSPSKAVPGSGEVAVRIHASSLNYHDYLVVTGRISVADGRIPLSDGAGEIIAVGDGVREFAVGDPVVSTFFPLWPAGRSIYGDLAGTPGEGIDGYARGQVIFPASYFTHAPRGYNHSEASTLPCAALTAWRALFVNATLKPGDSVLVQGTGGVSVFALQFAKAAGATVLATSGSDEKLERLKELGADYTLNYRETERWGSAAKAMLGDGFDHVVEVGGADTLPQSISACREGGHISVIGILSGVSGKIPTSSIMAKQLRLSGLMVGSPSHQRDMVRAIDRLGIKPCIDTELHLDDIADAFKYQATGKHFGKIVLVN